MTNCSEFQKHWSDWHAGDLDGATRQLLWQHAQQCQHCAAYHRQMQAMLKALNSLPAPGPTPAGLNERLFANAGAGRPQKRYDTARRLSIAASVLVVVLGAVLLNPWAPDDARQGATQVLLSVDRPKNVHVVFDAEDKVRNVEYTIELPDGVEVDGYPGLEVLRWTGELQAGRNGLTLPLVGRRIGTNGVLKARIRYRDVQRELNIPVQTPEHKQSDNRSSGETMTSVNVWNTRGIRT